MMKIFLMLMFMMFMMFKNKMLMFYYNICFLGSFMMLFMYMFKDEDLNYSMGLNLGNSYYSILLVILSLWILGLMMMCLDSFSYSKILMFLILLILLLMFFSSLDLLMFYFSFEVSIIPTFFLIVYWGMNPERVSAAYYLLLYMLLFSFPLLVYLMSMYIYGGTFKFSLMMMIMENYEMGILKFFMIYMAFFIKMPIYLMHMWLPRAHVEAPVYGSMILAGVLLKMGSYGLMRLLIIFMKESLKFSYLVFSVSIVGSFLMSVVCLVQVDMKMLVAYSSVVHMNMMICSLMTMTKMGFMGSYIMMVGHGLCSSGMFYMVTLYYDRSMSRMLVLNKGMLKILPSLSIWWFLFCVSNFSFPFSVNFISEVLMLSVIINWDNFMITYLLFICFFSSAYSLYLYSYLQYGGGGGVFSYLEKKILFSLIKEILIIMLHLLPLIMLLLNMIMFM